MILRGVAPYWLGIGLAGLMLCAAIFASHYIFEIPLQAGPFHKLLKYMEFINFGIMLAGFAFCAIFGGLILRYISKD